MLSSLKKVSVIIPAYQIEDYIKNCIESVIKQSYSNLEIIVVDDGSTDKTGKILEDYKRIDKRIKIITKKNGGLSDARNVALDNSTGEYVTFVDGDDCIHCKMIEILLSKIIEYNVDIAYCHFTFCNDAAVFCEVENITDCTVMDREQALKVYYGNNNINIVTACNKLIKKKLFEGVRFPVGRIHEDVATIYKILDKADRVLEINKGLYFYIQRSNSIMNGGISKNKEDLFISYDEMFEYFKGNNEIIDLVRNRYKYALNRFYRKSVYQWIGGKKDKKNFQKMLRERYKNLTGKSMPVLTNYILVPLHKIKEIIK